MRRDRRQAMVGELAGRFFDPFVPTGHVMDQDDAGPRPAAKGTRRSRLRPRLPLWPRKATVSASIPSYVMLFLVPRVAGVATASGLYMRGIVPVAQKLPAKRACRGLGYAANALAAHLRTLVERSFVSLVLIPKKIDDLVVARREVDVAQHLAATRALALDMDRKVAPLTLSASGWCRGRIPSRCRAP